MKITDSHLAGWESSLGLPEGQQSMQTFKPQTLDLTEQLYSLPIWWFAAHFSVQAKVIFM